MGGRRLAGTCMMLLVVWTGVRAESAQEILEKVRKKYASIQDAEVKFSQQARFAMARIEQRVSGVLYFKKGNKYRVELEGQTIVTDGITVWSYSLANNQVLVDTFVLDERAISPEKILVAAPGDYSATLIGKEQLKKKDLFVLKLVPREEHAFVTSMKLWVDEDDWLMKKVELTDANGKETTYTVAELSINTGLQDSRFVFEIPAGAEVVDLR